MTDLIDRQDAIDAICKACNELFFDQPCEPCDCEIRNAVNVLPSAQPERKTGAWCVTSDGQLVCSNCYSNPTNRIIVDGSLIYDMTPIRERMKFCPNCGSFNGGNANVNE